MNSVGWQNPRSPKLFRTLDRFDLCLILLLVTSYMIVAMLPFAPQKFGDDVFHKEAKTIALALRGAQSWANVRCTRAPGPVLYYAIPYLAVPPNSSDNGYWLSGFIWSVAWMVVSILLLRRAAEMSFGTSVGKLATILTLMLPFNVYYSYGISGEPPAYAAVTLFIYGWLRSRASTDKPSLIDANSSLTCLGLLFFLLCRPNAVLLLPIGMLAALLMWRSQREGRFALAIVLLVSVIYILSFIVLARLPGSWQSGNFSHVLFHGRFQYRTEPWDWRFWDDSTRQGSVDYALFSEKEAKINLQHHETGVPISELKRAWAVNDAISHPGITLRMALVRALSLHVALVNSKKPEEFKIGPVQGRVAYFAFHIAVNATYLLVIGGAIGFLLRRRGTLAGHWALWGPWVALLIFHAATYAEPRYMFPSQPGLVIMAAAILGPTTTLLRRWCRDWCWRWAGPGRVGVDSQGSGSRNAG